MIQYVCDFCTAVKEPGEAWILGRAAEAVGVTAARREVTILSGWDRERAVHPLAVHFCSLECKDNYMARLFAPEAPVEEVVVKRSVPTEVAVQRTSPSVEKVVTKTRTRKSRPGGRAA